MRAVSAWSLAFLVAGCGGGAEEPADDGGTTGADGTSSDPSLSDGNTPTTVEGSSGASTPTSGPDPTGGDDAASTEDGSDPDDTGGGDACVDDHRVVAFLANWTECPTAEQLAQYSHVVIAFAVTYTYDPGGNICDETCTIGPVDGCLGTPLPDLVGQLHDAGIEVLVSFGGAGMGGIWEGTCGQMTKCWDHCIDQVDSLAAQLTGIVADNDLDGVDIDYEYCLNDASYTGFVEGLTTELRASLDAQFPDDHKLVTHAPMDSELEAGDPYYEIAANVAGDLDFLMPQYYNGGLSPFTRDGLAAIQEHYAALVDGVFGGDASRVVVGFCIEPGCNPVATQPEATNVIETFDAAYPDHGGLFFWAHPNDTDAWFSAPFRTHYDETVCAR